jgi:hypothetical protein
VATGGAGRNGGSGFGGGLYVDSGSVCLEQSRITDNQAIGGSATAGLDGQGTGGGVYVATGTVGVKQTRIDSNHASTSDDDVFGDLGGDC